MHRAKASRHVFLFDRMVLITKRREDATLAYKAHIMVRGALGDEKGEINRAKGLGRGFRTR